MKQVRIIALVVVAVVAVISLIYIAASIFFIGPPSAPVAVTLKDKPQQPASTEPAEAYRGQEESVADTFKVKVPNGWSASIADTGNFRAVMFARPEQLTSLTYTADTPPAVDRYGIPTWNGLTEHFFILTPTAANAFDAANHREISSERFKFNDGTVGTKYTVLKHAEEAKQYGGLLRDSEWQGCTYIYEKNGIRVEAHLALYASSTVDKKFFESVARTVEVN